MFLLCLVPTLDALSPPVAVIGASGNVGKLVVAKLLDDGCDVRAIVRSDDSAARLKEWRDTDVVVADITRPDSRPALEAALKGVTKVVVVTGTTAFPTQAWAGGDVAPDGVSAAVVSALLDNDFDAKRALDALSARGMCTPDVVDAQGVERLASCFDSTLDRVVLMSSVGVTKRDSFPFKILNAAGVLDAKARGEAAIATAAKTKGATFAILRPGQLFGPPYDNDSYLGTIFRLDKSAETRAVKIAPGDVDIGDTLRSTIADALVASLTNPAVSDRDFTVLNVQGDDPDTAALNAQLESALASSAAFQAPPLLT